MDPQQERSVQSGELVRLAAFADEPSGGNPAGVWIGDELPSASAMHAIAADVGYSETAFLAPAAVGDWWVARYHSPEAEVSFCGHATIAAGIVLAQRHGDGAYRLRTAVGDVPVEVHDVASGRPRATLTSVMTEQRECPTGLLAVVLRFFGWSEVDLDPALPPALSYAGAWHLVLALRHRSTLAGLTYDFDGVRQAMADHDLTTLQIVWRRDEGTFHARNPFPVGGVVEDPATGAAAAALGAYLRDHRGIATPADIQVHQGDDMGRPSRLSVHIPKEGGMRVTGTAVPIPA
jgi:PhzF family phenazine biosynthesis protein